MATKATNTISAFCKKVGITEAQFYGKEKIEGNLYLRSLTSIPEGFNPTVGGNLDLGSLTSIPEGFNPTVGGNLDLGSLTSIPEGFNPTVGGNLYLRSGRRYIGSSVHVEVETPNAFFWGKYALIDRIFCEVDVAKASLIGGQEYEVRQARRIARKEIFFIVSRGNLHAHGSDFKSAFEDLQFKILSRKLKNEPITAETLITVNHYRAITGACNLGCKEFMDRHKIDYTEENDSVKEKSPIKAKDLLKLLKKENSYGVERFEKLMR